MERRYANLYGSSFVEGATQHAISNAHEMDLEIQDKHEIQFMTYWFDEARCKAFCLVGAPNKAAIQNAHNEAHGMVPHEIIEVDPMIVEAFLGRVKDPAPVDKSGEAPIDGAYRVIMFTDLQDSTLMTTMFGDAKALHLLHIHNALTRNALRDHRGNEVKHTGDGIGLLLCLYRTESSVLLQSKKRSISITESTLNRHCICGLALALVNPLRSMVTFLEMQSNWRPAFVTMQSHARFLLHRWYIQDQCKDVAVPFSGMGEITPKGFGQAI